MWSCSGIGHTGPIAPGRGEQEGGGSRGGDADPLFSPEISIFHHGLTHFFATQGEAADSERARWVADVSRVLRMLTQSLFPQYSIAVDPVPGATWTATRLMAGIGGCGGSPRPSLTPYRHQMRTPDRRHMDPISESEPPSPKSANS